MGASYSGYTADVTVSFPANGKFTDDQRAIYNAVLAASCAVMDAIRPGIHSLECLYGLTRIPPVCMTLKFPTMFFSY